MKVTDMSEQPHCYLDGRYIAPALADVPEFLPEPIIVDIVFNAKEEVIAQSIRSDFLELQSGTNIIRVVVRSSYMRHSALLWIDTQDETATYTDTVGKERDHIGQKVHPLVDELLRQYTSVFGYTLVIDRIEVPDILDNTCDQVGFCNAYVIKQVWDWQDGVAFDPTSFNVRDLARDIERDFVEEIDLTKPAEVEYYHGGYRGGWGGAGLGVGLLGGLAIGGLATSAAQPAYYYPQPYPYYSPYGYYY